MVSSRSTEPSATVLRVCRNPRGVPTPLDHGGKILARLEAPPCDPGAPDLEERPGSRFPAVGSRLTERLLGSVRSVGSLFRCAP